jgi:hypothetical protein
MHASTTPDASERVVGDFMAAFILDLYQTGLPPIAGPITRKKEKPLREGLFAQTWMVS